MKTHVSILHKKHVNMLNEKHCISSIIRQNFSLQNNPKNLDPSYKMDPDFWDFLGRVKSVLQQNFIGLTQLFIITLEKGKPVFQLNKYSKKNYP